MADFSNQRVPDYCSPKHPDETEDDHSARWKAHRDAWRQQFLDDYYRPKETRLPSPNSEEDENQDEVAETVAFIERCIRLENGRPEPGDLPNRVLYPPVIYPPGKSLSEVDENESYSRATRLRPEDVEYMTPSEYREAMEKIGWTLSPIPRGPPEDEESEQMWERMQDSHPDPTLVRKRSSSLAEDGSLDPPAKRRRTDTNPEIPQAGPSTSGNKRKRVQDGNLDEPQVAREQAQAGPKKRRTDTYNQPSLASATSGSKRKRGSGPDETHNYEVQASQPVGAKRRRVDETLTNDADGGRGHNHTTQTAQQKAAATPSPRVTRARRRQLSGTDAQLFQLGQRGQVDLQGQAHEIQGQAAEAAADSSRRRQSPANTNTKARPKASNTTNTVVKTRATTNTSTGTKASVKSRAGKNTNTMTKAGTKTRGGRPNRRVLTQNDD